MLRVAIVRYSLPLKQSLGNIVETGVYAKCIERNGYTKYEGSMLINDLMDVKNTSISNRIITRILNELRIWFRQRPRFYHYVYMQTEWKIDFNTFVVIA